MLCFYVKLKSCMIDANEPTPSNVGTGGLLRFSMFYSISSSQTNKQTKKTI